LVGRAEDELINIDLGLSSMFPDADLRQAGWALLDALEALFFSARGGTLGRSVLLVDEISKATNEGDVYRNVVEWVDAGGVRVAGRRGAVFTGLSVQTPWAHETASGRSVVRLALGLFDVWDPQLQNAILLDMRKRPKWANVTSLPAAIWSLLVSAGGRPRYREYCGGGEGSSYRQGQPQCPVAIAEQSDLGLYVVFRRYLLPSLLNVQFVVHDGTNPTQFGRDVTSRSLRNSDLLADTSLQCRCAFSHASRASCSRFLSVS
jgi:hypothetical protein